MKYSGRKTNEGKRRVVELFYILARPELVEWAPRYSLLFGSL
jgi:hypothetical protein